ncbi:hypothetical protein FOMPIDRAFT_1056849 [Fomitopsis schrenkii]|uniref:Uncharacterized protein n=1 Tax=Fomitopsis schrenkii TaxID=2126942 RepID=S8F093_FOMSC|nr:hypothetical protein FOMPIDRAFT_1056849 [Fomitopsis schrenkii]
MPPPKRTPPDQTGLPPGRAGKDGDEHLCITPLATKPPATPPRHPRQRETAEK